MQTSGLSETVNKTSGSGGGSGAGRKRRRRRRRWRRSHGALRYRRPCKCCRHRSPPRHEERWEQQHPIRRRGARFTWNSKALATMQHMMEMQKQEDKEKKALPRPCTFCYEKAQCALYHKASTSEKEDIERANAAATSGLGEERFGALTGHLTDA